MSSDQSEKEALKKEIIAYLVSVGVSDKSLLAKALNLYSRSPPLYLYSGERREECE